MIKKQLLIMGLAASACGIALANEYRAPLVIERGPLRYDITEKPDKWTFETWTALYSREANRSFLKHGTDTVNLPAVIFGKETFTIGESFEQNDVVLKTGFFENGNPFFFTSKFTPEAQYTDNGFMVGARVEFPVCGNKGRIGVRGALPFRTVRLEPNDDGDCLIDGSNDTVIRGDQVRMLDAAGTPLVFTGISRYKLSLVNQLREITTTGNVQPVMRLSPAGTPSGFHGTQYNLNSGTGDSITNSSANPQGYDNAPHEIPVVMMRSNNGQFPPFQTPVPVTVVGATGAFKTGTPSGANERIVYGAVGTNLSVPNNNGVAPALSDLFALNPDLSQVTAANQNKGFAFTQDRDYTNIAAQDNFDELWVTPVFDSQTQLMTQEAAAFVNFIEPLLQRYQIGSECALAQQCFEFDTYERTGLGDLDVDVFYEHTFGDKWRTEVWLGVRFPTGAGNKFCGNPYRIALGNGEHFEIKVGGLAAWQTPAEWLLLKADLSYSWVLESEEKRTTAFKGATVNNIGYCTCADVSWGYLTGHVDFNFYHPKSNKLGTMIGYEIYYKTEDNVRFKKSTTTDSFLGRVFGNPTTGVPADGTNTGSEFIPYAMTLSNCVAERNTERIAHRVRTEMNWHAHKYWSLFLGGAYTFAGKNIFRESDVHGGIAVRY